MIRRKLSCWRLTIPSTTWTRNSSVISSKKAESTPTAAPSPEHFTSRTSGPTTAKCRTCTQMGTRLLLTPSRKSQSYKAGKQKNKFKWNLAKSSLRNRHYIFPAAITIFLLFQIYLFPPSFPFPSTMCFFFFGSFWLILVSSLLNFKMVGWMVTWVVG